MGTDITTTRRLTERQTSFIGNYISLGDAYAAAIAAGYSESTARSEAKSWLAMPHILAAIQNDVKRGLAADAPNSIRVLRELRDNPEARSAVRRDCAKTLLDRAGHVAPRATAPDNATETPLHEMTVDQLKDLAGRLEGELAGRAKVINSASASATDDQATDLVG